jgi:hypothetical protein
MTSPCLEGYHPTPICAPCGLGEYKESVGASTCQKCLNGPENSFYLNNKGWPNSSCMYECSSGWNKSINPTCQSAIFIYVSLSISPYGYYCLMIITVLLITGYFMRKTYRLRKKIIYETSINFDSGMGNISVPPLISHE